MFFKTHNHQTRERKRPDTILALPLITLAWLATSSASVFSQFTEQQKLTASDAAAFDWFGFSVSVSGDTAVVGVPFDDDAGASSGSAYVFVHSGGAWTQQQKLTASDAAVDDFFGGSVSVSGDTIVVGANGDGDPGPDSDAGSTYVFVRSGGVWTQQQKLTASDAAAGDHFGESVSVSGDTALVGAYLSDDAGRNSGSAYIFGRSGGVWTQLQKLSASDAAADDHFGRSVSVSVDTAIVGAIYDDDAGSDSGSAYVYVRSGGVWTQQQKLTALDAAAGDVFGISVSVSGVTAVVGARGDDNAGNDSGSAYVFVRSAGLWTQQQKLTAVDAAADDQFGYSVSISEERAVVGALLDDDAGPQSGSAYVFVRTGGLWTQKQKLTALDAAENHEFGISVSVSGDTAVVGAYRDDDDGLESGSAYAFEAPFITEILRSGLVRPSGIAVDGASNVYVVGGFSDNALKITPGGIITEIIDYSGDGAGNTLKDPIAIAVDQAGNVYVAGYLSQNAFRISAGGAIAEIIDATGDGAGNTLNGPEGIAVDGAGNVYVSGFTSNNAFKISHGGGITEIIDVNGSPGIDSLNRCYGITADGAGNVYVAGYVSDNAFKITPGGTITEIIDASGDDAGNPLDGTQGIAVDGTGNVYVSGFLSDNAFKITPLGEVTEIIDSAGDEGGNILNAANEIAVDGVGNVYVSGLDTDNAFKITPGGTITEIIDATGAGAGDTLDRTTGIAVSGSGNVYVVGYDTNNAFKIMPGGGITQIIDATGEDNGVPMGGPNGVAVDSDGNVYVVGYETDNAFMITPAGVTTEIIDATGDGAGNALDGPFGVAVDAAANIYVSGALSDNAFKITPGGLVTKIIDANGDGNLLETAVGIAVDDTGNVYVAGHLSNNVFKIAPGGTITQIIGASGAGAGQALGAPYRVAVDGVGNVYVSAWSNNAFKITPGGLITEIINAAGDQMGHTLVHGYGIAVDGLGNVFVAGGLSDNAFKVTPGGMISEIINGTSAGSPLVVPDGMAVDGAGNVYLSALASKNVFKIPPVGMITEVMDASGDGGSNTFSWPRAIAVDAAGSVYVSGELSHNVFFIALNCGNSLLDPGEQCDDGGNIYGDGCGYNCFVEPGNECADEPSVCGPDCNGNAVPDQLDIPGTSNDCNLNQVPDECEIDQNSMAPGGPFYCTMGCVADCNNNGVPDSCDIANCPMGTLACDDCNLNSVPDACDIAAMTSMDADTDGIPDECSIWQSPVNTDWNNEANWQPPQIPDNSGGANYAVTIATSVVNLNIVAEIDSLRLLNGATLNIDSDDTLHNLTIETESGIIDRGIIVVGPNHQIIAPTGAILIDSCISSSPADGGCGPPGISVHASSLVQAASLEVRGNRAVEVAADAAITIENGLALVSGTYREDPLARPSPVTTAALGAGEALITNSLDGQGSMILTDAMQAATSGNFVVRPDAVCTGTNALLGGCGPPSLQVLDSATLMVGGDLIIYPGSEIMIGGTSFTSNTANHADALGESPSIMLSGDFDNRATAADTMNFNLTGAQLILGGSNQFFELAGEVRGHSPTGFVDNFAMGTIEVASGATVVFGNTRNNVGSVAASEALYVNTLVFRAGADVTIDRGNVYFEQLVDEGAKITMTNGGLLLSTVPSIPTTTQWGLLVMALILMTTGTIIFRPCRSPI